MRIMRRDVLFVVTFMLAGATAASAQMGIRPPEIRGVWKPVVGSGAAYKVDAEGGHKMEFEIAVVDSETVEGKSAYWLEMAMESPREGGPMYVKHLIVLDGKLTHVKRAIFQAPGQPPMEMPVEMMARGGGADRLSDYREQAERVGSESVTTPAGTFTCEHWRMKDGSGEVWFSEKVSPYGLVKTTGRESNVTLVRLITNAKTHIIGTPQKFDPMERMRRQRNNP